MKVANITKTQFSGLCTQWSPDPGHEARHRGWICSSLGKVWRSGLLTVLSCFAVFMLLKMGDSWMYTCNVPVFVWWICNEWLHKILNCFQYFTPFAKYQTLNAHSLVIYCFIILQMCDSWVYKCKLYAWGDCSEWLCKILKCFKIFSGSGHKILKDTRLLEITRCLCFQK